MTTSRRFHFHPFERQPSPYPFHDRQQKDRFLHLVRERLGRDGAIVTIDNGLARVEGSEVLHGLTNIAQVCNQAPADKWPSLIDAHFAKSESGRIADGMSTLTKGGFEQSADHLVVRIYPLDFVSSVPVSHFVHRVDLQETCTVLALDIGATVIPVPALVAEAWGLPHPVLFERALDNLVRTSKARWSTLSIPPPHEFTFDLLHGDFHAPTHLLRRDPGLPRTGTHGNLIGLPACGVVVSYPIDAAVGALTLESLLAITIGKFTDGPSSITPHLYWRTPAGNFHLQRAKREADRTRFMPSPEFVEQMVLLQKARPASGS